MRIITSTLMIVVMGFLAISAYAGDLDALQPVTASQGWGQLMVGKSVQGGPIRIGDRTFRHGLGTHAPSEVVYDLGGQYDRFAAWVGVDAEMKDYTASTVVFKVFGDGRELFSSGIMRIGTPAKRVDVPIHGIAELRLVVEDAGDGQECDHADWADPVLFGNPKRVPEIAPKPKRSIRAPGITLKLSARGEICAVVLGKTEYPMTGSSRLRECREGDVSVRKLPNGGMEFTRNLTRLSTADKCTITERFIPTKTSIRWEMEILGIGAPWSTPIITQLRWPETTKSRFWTAWDDPQTSGTGWHDPLVAIPFVDKGMWIGAPPGQGNYTGGDAVTIPIASILIPSTDAGLSLVLSPEDTYLETALTTGRDGTIRLTRLSHRISSAHTVRFAADIVPHKSDWRAGLGWMVNRYPQFFNPPNPRADQIVGCGAYSFYEGDLDVAKFKKMSFRVNWKASFDFPYIGMFLPPVSSDTEKWPRFDADSGGQRTAAHTETSIAQMSDYSRRMRADGFYVLNYFNVTEFGAGMRSAPGPRMQPGDSEMWRDPQQFVANTLQDAVLISESGRQLGSWGGAIIMDCGVKSYQDFLMAQARRHIEKLPYSSGICIDRMDWLRQYSQNGDDGVSWRGKPLRAVSESWKSTMARLGPLMHANDKVIFVNPLLARLDLMKEVDGVYHEFGDLAPCLNAEAFLCVRKPAISWAHDASGIGDPDTYFQRHLYLGVYPTAPFPGNDHTIRPSEQLDKWYLDYGPLLDLMRGKKWVLEPHVIEVEGGAKANLFAVPGGYALPVVFGGKAENARVTIRKPSALAKWPPKPVVQAFHPGSDQPVTLTATVKGDLLKLTVPLVRGCAMVRISGF